MGFMFGYCLSSFMFGAIFRWQENALFVRDFRNVLAIYVPTSGIWLGVYNGYIQEDLICEIVKTCDIPIEVGGGIRTMSAIDFYIEKIIK